VGGVGLVWRVFLGSLSRGLFRCYERRWVGSMESALAVGLNRSVAINIVSKSFANLVDSNA